MNFSLDSNVTVSSIQLTVRGKTLDGRNVSKSCRVNNPTAGKDIDLRLTAQQLEVLQAGGAQLELKIVVKGSTTATLNTLTLTDNRTQLTADRNRAGVSSTPSIPQP